MSQPADRWAAADHYEDFMGRWSRALARRFVAWLAAPRGLHWLDVGCGTGALAHAICIDADPDSVLGCDPAPAFIAYAAREPRDPRASFVVAGAGELPPRPGGYDRVVSLLALNFFLDIEAGLADMCAVAAPGATIAACVWDYAAGMGSLRRFWDAAVALDPAAAERDEGARFPICQPGPLTGLFDRAGLVGVRCEPLTIPTTYADFTEYWRPLLGGTGPAPAYVASLTTEARELLSRALDGGLPRGPGGEIPLTARAWAVRGERK